MNSGSKRYADREPRLFPTRLTGGVKTKSSPLFPPRWEFQE